MPESLKIQKTSKVSPALLAYFLDYEKYHLTPGNKICHYLGIPMIVMTLFGLLMSIPIYSNVDLGGVLWAIGTVFYFNLDWRLGLAFSVLTLGIYLVSRFIPTPFLWIFFIAGWAIQFLGHYYYEKKSPAFFKNFEHLLIGPIWIFSKAVRYH